MKQGERHEAYCSCLTCKPRDTMGGENADFWELERQRMILYATDPSTEDTGDWPLIKPEEGQPPQPLSSLVKPDCRA